MEEPPLVLLLGLPFHDLTLDETIEECGEMMSTEDPNYIVTANADFTTQANQDEDLRRIVFFADRVVCDGMPLVWLSRLFGYPLRERVAGSDMVPRLLELCAKDGHGVYFFGSDMGTLENAKEIAEERYPGLKVVGCDAPPMGAVVEWDNDAICERMKASGAHLLLVCLGCPKQERWIFSHYAQAGIPLSIGVGASLDFITGKQVRAPKWMQKIGMEWFWRMASNPRRLALRYFKDFLFLSRAAISQWRLAARRDKIVLAPDRSIENEKSQDSELLPQVIRLWWSGNLAGEEVEQAELPDTVDRPVLLDLSKIGFMDSAGLGRFAQLVRNCREAGHPLLVISPSRFAVRAIEHAKLESLAPQFSSHSAALMHLATRARRAAKQSTLSPQVETTICFTHDLDAVHIEEIDKRLSLVVAEAEGTVILDLAQVDFLDSMAVGALVRTRKAMVAKGHDLVLTNPTPAVKKLISLLKLEQVLPVRREVA